MSILKQNLANLVIPGLITCKHQPMISSHKLGLTASGFPLNYRHQQQPRSMKAHRGGSYRKEKVGSVYYHTSSLGGSHQVTTPDSRVHGANMGPTWGRQDPGWPHVGPMNLAICEGIQQRWEREGCLNIYGYIKWSALFKTEQITHTSWIIFKKYKSIFAFI